MKRVLMTIIISMILIACGEDNSGNVGNLPNYTKATIIFENEDIKVIYEFHDRSFTTEPGKIEFFGKNLPGILSDEEANFNYRFIFYPNVGNIKRIYLTNDGELFEIDGEVFYNSEGLVTELIYQHIDTDLSFINTLHFIYNETNKLIEERKITTFNGVTEHINVFFNYGENGYINNYTTKNIEQNIEYNTECIHDENGLLAKIIEYPTNNNPDDLPDTTFFEYNSEHLLGKKIINWGDVKYINEYSYNESRKFQSVITRTIYYDVNEETTQTNYFYDNQGYLIRVEYKNEHGEITKRYVTWE